VELVTAHVRTRLRKALALDAVRDGDAWHVGDHLVHPTGDPGAQCSCPDHRYRREPCKHVLAVRLALRDPATLDALRVLLAPGPASRAP